MLSLVALVVFAGCDGTGSGSSSDGGAAKTPVMLERCKPGKAEQDEDKGATTPSATLQSFGGIELHTNGDVVGFVEDEQCRVRVGYV